MGWIEGENHLVICFFDEAAPAQRGIRLLQDESPELYGRVALLLRKNRSVCLMEADLSAASDVDPVIGQISGAIKEGTRAMPDEILDKGSDLSADDIIRLAVELECDHAAVVLMGSRGETDRAIVELTRLGGRAELHRITT